MDVVLRHLLGPGLANDARTAKTTTADLGVEVEVVDDLGDACRESFRQCRFRQALKRGTDLRSTVSPRRPGSW